MKKRFFFVAGMLLAFMYLTAQISTIRSYTVGDTISQIKFNTLLNYKTKSAKLSDFKGKAVIIDYWATWCPPCVDGLVKFSGLQDAFRDNIMIIPVNGGTFGDSKEKIQQFLAKKDIRLPTAFDETKVLQSLFPHFGIPHCVVIDKHRVVRAVTTSAEIDKDYLTGLVNNRPPILAPKIDMSPDDSKKRLMEHTGETGNILWHSQLNSAIPGGTRAVQVNANGNFRMTYYNFSLAFLFCEAFQRPSFIYNRLVMENVTDSAKIKIPDQLTEKESARWNNANSYCYEVETAEYMKDERFNIMLGDLNNYCSRKYNFTAAIEKRATSCIMLVKIADDSVIMKNSATHKIKYFNVRRPYIFRDAPVSSLINSLAAIHTRKPIIDATGFPEEMTIGLENDLRSFDLVNKELEKFGFKMVEAVMEIDMIVLRNRS